MCYEIIPTEKFIDDLEHYERKRKFRHIDDDVQTVVDELEKGNLIGDAIDGLSLPCGEDTYKVRAVNSDMRQGKSNGYRILYYAIKNDKTIYLLTVYYKKDNNRIPSKNEIKDLIEKYVCN